MILDLLIFLDQCRACLINHLLIKQRKVLFWFLRMSDVSCENVHSPVSSERAKNS